MTTAMTAMLKQFQATPPPAPVKAVEETCVTCGDAHPYYQCPTAGGNTFPEFRDNIQGYVSAAADSYEVPTSTASTTTTDTTSGGTELWAAILKTFGGNEATKKTKKNLLKQQYGNFKAEGSETLEQTFNRLQVIVGQLQFMDIEIKQDDLNQKFLTSLAPEWLMHTIVWRKRSDLDTMSLDDLYNHLKVYEPEVQKKLEPNSQNMAFISSAKHSRGNEDVNKNLQEL
nr:hypothetical protein [Tanacetum cinerariifolium]